MPLRPHLGVAEFAVRSRFDLAAELLGHGLHPIANAQHRHTQFKHKLRSAGRVGHSDGFRPAGQDDSTRLESADIVLVAIPRMDFAIHTDFADAPGD